MTKDEDLRELLKRNIPPASETQLTHDLWPKMLRRLDQQQSVRVPWFDWALGAVAAAALVLFPGVVPALLYHL
jgi:hypothetical protein